MTGKQRWRQGDGGELEKGDGGGRASGPGDGEGVEKGDITTKYTSPLPFGAQLCSGSPLSLSNTCGARVFRHTLYAEI